ncbi:MAG TPA: phage holin family protein [Gaiellaceae bacterium]|jgi:putative membrane protein
MPLALRLVVAWAVNVVALWVAVKLFDNVTSSGWRALIIAGLVFGIVNALVRPVLVILSLPLVLVTFGFFLFFINMAMLALTDWVVGGFDIEGFWTYVGATIVVWLVNAALESFAERSF